MSTETERARAFLYGGHDLEEPYDREIITLHPYVGNVCSGFGGKIECKAIDYATGGRCGKGMYEHQKKTAKHVGSEVSMYLFPADPQLRGQAQRRATMKHMSDKFWHYLARHLPKRLAYWSYIVSGVRHIASNEVVPEVGYTEILQRMDKS